MTLDLVIRAQRAVVAGTEQAAAVGIRGGRIVTFAAVDASLDADEKIALGENEVLLPGLVDTHVHVNEPGRTEWEGFATATRAAAAGDVTTIVDMLRELTRDELSELHRLVDKHSYRFRG